MTTTTASLARPSPQPRPTRGRTRSKRQRAGRRMQKCCPERGPHASPLSQRHARVFENISKVEMHANNRSFSSRDANLGQARLIPRYTHATERMTEPAPEFARCGLTASASRRTAWLHAPKRLALALGTDRTTSWATTVRAIRSLESSGKTRARWRVPRSFLREQRS